MLLQCPQCSSVDLSASYQERSNPLLQKGLPYFSGYLNNPLIKLHCNACRFSFKPGEALQGLPVVDPINNTAKEALIIQTIREKGLLETIATYQQLSGVKFAEAKTRVEDIAKARGLSTKMKTPASCYLIILLALFILSFIVIGIYTAFKK